VNDVALNTSHRDVRVNFLEYWEVSARKVQHFRRFLQKNILSQEVKAGRIRISQYGSSESRSRRASIACIVRLLKRPPF
jgi:hypothetical protein